MKPDLGRAYPIDWTGYPPHMAPLDLPIWRRYLKLNHPTWIRAYFDAALGDGADVPAGGDPAMEKMWSRITRKRTDVIIETATGWLIIEIRHNAGLGAIGAILGYKALWEADPPDPRPLEILILTNLADRDTLAAAKAADVPIFPL